MKFRAALPRVPLSRGSRMTTVCACAFWLRAHSTYKLDV